MILIPDDPFIRNCERTGYPDGKKPVYPICPICGAQCETLYRDFHGVTFGCDECVMQYNAWEMPECFPGKENE